jgi:hypothetical protein
MAAPSSEGDDTLGARWLAIFASNAPIFGPGIMSLTDSKAAKTSTKRCRSDKRRRAYDRQQ